MKNILFITWDGPQTNYLEGLFLPILNGIAKSYDIRIHVIQFTWAGEDKLNEIKSAFSETNLLYTPFKVVRKPLASVGVILSIVKGSKAVERYITKNGIDIVMPRSSMPAIIVNRIKKKKFKIIYDADGLNIQERVDFAGLSTQSLTYKLLNREEKTMLLSADRVITRTQKAIDFHINNLGKQFRNKFSTVANGREPNHFLYQDKYRLDVRNELGISPGSKVFLYAGSLGDQYCWEEMATIFNNYLEYNNNAVLLILTGDIGYLKNKQYPVTDKVIVRRVPFNRVNEYMCAADIALALRKPKLSMLGVAPIKLGEYMLTGLPVVMSKGIGDTDEIFKNAPGCYVFDHDNENNIDEVVEWIKQMPFIDREAIRNFALTRFSLQKSIADYMYVIDSLK